ncbi:hypothetical protein KI387_003469, partial [Taxus chinensis]
YQIHTVARAIQALSCSLVAVVENQGLQLPAKAKVLMPECYVAHSPSSSPFQSDSEV